MRRSSESIVTVTVVHWLKDMAGALSMQTWFENDDPDETIHE